MRQLFNSDVLDYTACATPDMCISGGHRRTVDGRITVNSAADIDDTNYTRRKDDTTTSRRTVHCERMKEVKCCTTALVFNCRCHRYNTKRICFMTLLRTGKVQGEVAAAIYDPSRITDY